ncbi:MAG: spore maturation protein [Gammaproteobacteria bacterium]
MIAMMKGLSNGLFLSFIAGIPLYGAYKGIKVFDTFVIGAREGLNIVLTILPTLMGLLVAIGMFRAAGGFAILSHGLSPFLEKLGVPSDLVPIALVRPFSGGAANSLLADIVATHGADSLVSRMAATLQGSTETTLFVVATYFGAVGVKRTRHSIPAGLCADFAGAAAAVIICHWYF